MAQSNWEADKMLDVYIHDYLLKRKLHNSAKAFMAEGKVATEHVAIDAPGGFLFEWWSVFWDIFIARTNVKHSEAAASYIEAQQLKIKEQQQMQLQHLQMLQQRQAQMQQRNSGHMVNGDAMMGQGSASVMAMKMYEERMKLPHALDNESSSSLIDANKLAILKSAAPHQSPIPQGNPGSISSLQQIHGRSSLSSDGKSEVALGQMQKTMGVDPSIYGQVMQSKTGLGGAGLNQGVPNLPLKGWPLGMETMRPNMGIQMAANRPDLHLQNQFLLASQQQAMAPNYTQLPRGNLNARIEGSICSPGQSNSPKDPPQPNRKRKHHSSSGPANSTGTGNTTNSPTSSHPKSMLMYGADVTGGLATCADILDDFGDMASLDDNMEQFLNDGDSRELYAPLKQNPKEASKGSSFNELGCIRARSKVTCCHFSSDGKLLASAGHEKKVVLYNIDTVDKKSIPEEHKSIVTDIRFRPNSTQLATSSNDQTVRLWDATNPSYLLETYTGDTPVISLDFHPKKTDLFCFSNKENEVRYWHVSPFECARVFNGGSTQVRFQPRTGQLLAAASDKVVAVFDVETDRKIHSFQGHADVLNYICWDATGDVLASVSDSLVKVWSLTSGQCIYEFGSNGNEFHSCVFHPTYSTLLVVGGMSSLELWNMAENKSMTIAAHNDIVSALTQSPVTGMIASASHDASVKLWK